MYTHVYTLNVPFLRNDICCTKQKPTYSDVVEHATSPKCMVVLKGSRMVIQPAVEWDMDILPWIQNHDFINCISVISSDFYPWI